jgi:hypothetical protein
MGSIPGRFTGVGSAINNAISRVGQPLLGALIFIAISATFYSTLGALAPDLDTTSEAVRQQFPPINPPADGASEAQVLAANAASIAAFHQAMIVSAMLLAIAAAISWIGLRGTHGTTVAEASSTSVGSTPDAIGSTGA